MSERLRRDIGQGRPFASPRQAAFLELQRAASELMQAFARRLRPHGLTPTQYNVLRILRGSRPQAPTCGDIGDRMVTRVPDVTRLVDRLAARGLARKRRDDVDRRVVRVEILTAGLELLAALDEPVLAWLDELLAPLDETEVAELATLAEKARSDL